jgi:hypothetical protein
MSNYDNYTLNKMEAREETAKSFKDVQWEFFQATSQPTSTPGAQASAVFNSSTGWLANAIYDLSSSILTQNILITVTTGAQTYDSFIVAPKPSGWALSIIDRFTITIGQNTITQSSSRNPIFQWLKTIFGWSLSYFKMNGPLLYMGNELPEDEVRSWRACIPGTAFVPGGNPLNALAAYSNNVTPCGVDYNACPLSVSAATSVNAPYLGNATYNKAMYSRLLDMSYVTNTNGQRSNFVSVSATSCTYTVNVPVPLSVLHSFFDCVGLVKNLNMYFNVYYNTCSGVTNGYTAGAGLGDGTTALSGSFSYNYCPLMITNRAAVSSGLDTVIGAGKYSDLNPLIQSNLALAVPGVTGGDAAGAPCHTAIPSYSVANSNVTGVSLTINANLTPQLWTPRVIMKGSDAIKFDLHSKVVRYIDYTVAPDNIGSKPNNGQFNWIISGGCVAPKRIYVLGLPNAAATPLACSALINSVCPDGNYSSPLFQLDQIQFQVASQNLYLNPISGYDWRFFVQELRPLNPINGGQDPRFGVGLVSKRFFDNSKIYVFDVSRNVKDSNPVALTLLATNISNLSSVDMIAFIEQELEVTISFAPTGTSSTPYQYVL